MIVNKCYLIRPIFIHSLKFTPDLFHTYQSIAEQRIVVWKVVHKIHMVHLHFLKIFLFAKDSIANLGFILSLN